MAGDAGLLYSHAEFLMVTRSVITKIENDMANGPGPCPTAAKSPLIPPGDWSHQPPGRSGSPPADMNGLNDD
eukprot:12892845-Prorocentrum_lima.AAC.1